VIPRDHQHNDHGNHSSHKDQDYGGDAQEDPVLARLPLPAHSGRVIEVLSDAGDRASNIQTTGQERTQKFVMTP
jgi:hypothetical protein